MTSEALQNQYFVRLYIVYKYWQDIFYYKIAKKRGTHSSRHKVPSGDGTRLLFPFLGYSYEVVDFMLSCLLGTCYFFGFCVMFVFDVFLRYVQYERDMESPYWYISFLSLYTYIYILYFLYISCLTVDLFPSYFCGFGDDSNVMYYQYSLSSFSETGFMCEMTY